MSRLIFSKPIELDREANLFIQKIKEYNGILCDDLLSTMLSRGATLFSPEIITTERDVRKIAERINKRKYINCDNTVKYHKTKGKYFKVLKDTERANKVLNKIKFDAISALTTYKIYLEDMGRFEDVGSSLQLSMLSELLESYDKEVLK